MMSTCPLFKKSILLPIFLLCFSLFVVSCGGDDDKEPETADCDGVITVDGSMEVNGETLSLTIAQRIINAGGSSFGDTYAFQLAGVKSDCSGVNSVAINVSVPSGESINGTFPIKDFFDAGFNDAYGSFTSQILEPVSQSIVEMASGSVTIVDNGSSSYDINLNATLVGGGDLSMSISHQF